MQKLRLDDCTVTCLVEGDLVEKDIAPLLLITFVENAFKHVSDNLPENFIAIHIYVSADKLVFACRNSYEVKPNGTGIGLDNVRKRLSLIYGDRQQLRLHATNNIYEVNLELCLKS